MPRYNVQHPITLKWRCFSSIADNWVSDWMPEEEYDEWRKQQYGKEYCPLEEANFMTLDDAEKIIKDIHRTSSEHKKPNYKYEL